MIRHQAFWNGVLGTITTMGLVGACTDNQTETEVGTKAQDEVQVDTTAVARVGVSHPLDPLTADEITQAVNAVKARYPGNNVFFPVIRLNEPAKADVLAWTGGPIAREAFIVVFIDTPPSGQTHEVIVRVGNTSASIKKDTLRPGVQPPVLNAEFGIAASAPFNDTRFQNALIARGYGPETWGNLFCAPLSAGNYHVPAENGRRLFRVTCLDATVSNPWSHPLENLHAVVDLVTGQVIDVVDTGKVPASPDDGDFYNVPQAPAAKPLIVSNPNGDDYTVNNHLLTSPRWQLHFRVEGRDGLIVSGVKYNDKGTMRSVVYKASLSETFVPYADPTSNFYYRTYMDEGEYGFGKSTQPLTPGKDCPENATFYSATITDDVGNPFDVPNAVCVFEEKEYLGYHHADLFRGYAEVARAGRTIVLRYATIVGNYDYFFDWRFREDGSIGYRAGAGGVIEAKGQNHHTVTEAGAATDLKWGTLVSDRIGGPNHQHIFNLRLDMDVDGQRNTLAQLTPRVVAANEPGSKRKSGWVVDTRESTCEGPLDPAEHTQVTVFNEHKFNSVGNPVGYAIEGKNDTTLLMSDDDPPAARAAYTKHQAWVTPYDRDQIYVAGDYVFMDDGSTDGIQNWTQAHRNVNDTDLVVWANIGFSHIVHSENWPLMSTEWFGELELTPFNFFSKSPVLNINDNQ